MTALESVAKVILQFQCCIALHFMFRKESEYNMFNLSKHVKVAEYFTFCIFFGREARMVVFFMHLPHGQLFG